MNTASKFLTDWAQVSVRLPLPARQTSEYTRLLLDLKLSDIKQLQDTHWKTIDLDIIRMVDAYEQVFLNVTFPLGESGVQRFAEITGLLKARVDAMIDPDLQTERKSIFGGGKAVFNLDANTILRRLRILARYLALYYLTYQPLRTGLWKVIHRQFLIAIKRQFVLTENNGAVINNAITSAYIQTLSLALCNPSGFIDKQYAFTLKMIAKFANKSKLYISAPAQDNVNGLFLIPFKNDTAPLASMRAEPNFDENCLYLQIHEFAYELQLFCGQIERQLSESITAPLTQVGITYRKEHVFFIKTMLKSLAVSATRIFPRVKSSGTLQIRLGFYPIWHFTSNAEEVAEALTVNLLDRNIQGLAFAFDSRVNTKIHVGELLMFMHQQDEDLKWHLGVVRWLEFHADKNLCYAGCEVISYNISAWQASFDQNLETKSNNAKSYKNDIQELPALLAVMPPGISESSILLPNPSSDSTFHHNEQLLQLTLNQQSLTLLLSELLEPLGNFARYRYVPITD